MGYEIVTVDAQGRVTIPVQMRKRLGIAPGDRFWVKEEKDGLRLLPLSGRLKSSSPAPA